MVRKKILSLVVIIVCIVLVAACLTMSFMLNVHSTLLALAAVVSFLIMLKAISVFCGL